MLYLISLSTRLSLFSLPLLRSLYSLRHTNIEIRPINNPTIAYKVQAKGRVHISYIKSRKSTIKTYCSGKKTKNIPFKILLPTYQTSGHLRAMTEIHMRLMLSRLLRNIHSSAQGPRSTYNFQPLLFKKNIS
jgi:hypothetical protein